MSWTLNNISPSKTFKKFLQLEKCNQNSKAVLGATGMNQWNNICKYQASLSQGSLAVHISDTAFLRLCCSLYISSTQ